MAVWAAEAREPTAGVAVVEAALRGAKRRGNLIPFLKFSQITAGSSPGSSNIQNLPRLTTSNRLQVTVIRARRHLTANLKYLLFPIFRMC